MCLLPGSARKGPGKCEVAWKIKGRDRGRGRGRRGELEKCLQGAGLVLGAQRRGHLLVASSGFCLKGSGDGHSSRGNEGHSHRVGIKDLPETPTSLP